MQWSKGAQQGFRWVTFYLPRRLGAAFHAMAEMPSFTWESAPAAYSRGFWQLFPTPNKHAFSQHEQPQHKQK